MLINDDVPALCMHFSLFFCLPYTNVHFRPSSRIAAFERKLRIVNDSQAKAFTACSVQCATCGTDILLDGEEDDYNLTKWNEHKVHCAM
jgi:hypothetical protein